MVIEILPTSNQIIYAVHIFFNWNSFHARLNSHYKAWSYKKKISKILKYTGNLFRKNIQLKGIY